MKFSRTNGGVVAFCNSATGLMNGYRQLDATDAEAGGILLGRFITESDDVIIDEATAPSAQDKKGRFYFIRRRPTAQRRVDQAWHDSNGALNYLGEWHSHPEGDPTPSYVDIKNWRRISSRARYEQESLLFAIVGTVNTRVWEVWKTNGRLSELKQL